MPQGVNLNREPGTGNPGPGTRHATLSPVMPDDHRAIAKDRIRALRELLQRTGGDELTRSIEECEGLERAIDAFHMEAIRFRMYTLGRRFETYRAALPAEAATLLEEARAALHAAGFQTR